MTTIDSEQHVKEAVCQYLNNNPQGDFPAMEVKNVIALRIVSASIIVLIDCGIKGIPKFIIPTDKLEFNPKPISGSEAKLETYDILPAPSDDPKKKPSKRPPVNGRRKRGVKK